MGESNEASFNMAIATLIRIDSILKIIQKSALAEDLEEWEKALMQLRREIAPYIKSEELESITKTLKELKELEWVKIDESGRKVFVDKLVEQAEEKLDEITIACQQAMFTGGILMAIKENESSGGYD